MRGKRKKMGSGVRRGALALLTAALVCTLWPNLAAEAAGIGAIAYPYHEHAPWVQVEGNVVKDATGQPTGFYELALCVQTVVVREKSRPGTVVPWKEYEAALKADPAAANNYEVYNAEGFSFSSVAAALKIKTDVLTPVRWDAPYPEYAEWRAGSNVAKPWEGTYADNEYDPNTAPGPGGEQVAVRPTKFARGLDLTTADIINIQGAGYRSQVRLDTAKPDEVNTATALVEWYDQTGEETAVLTLSASTSGREGVRYTEMTPVVVVRFAYDLKRFPNPYEEYVFGVNDKETGTNGSGRAYEVLLTSLAGDASAALSSVHQEVWFQAAGLPTTPGQPTDQDLTMFYYYDGADNSVERGEEPVDILGEPETVMLPYPNTAGRAVLTEKTGETLPTDRYSYMRNLLYVDEGIDHGGKSLYFHLVSKETYRKATGGEGGITILYYDWDDTLIGAQIVGNGDVRAKVNQYVEEHFIHPKLRASYALAKAKESVPSNVDFANVLTDPTYKDVPAVKEYKDILNSIDREFTYRGVYSSKPDGSGESYPEDGSTSGKFDRVEDKDTPYYGKSNQGKDYPLTNKLDYAFYRRVNTKTVGAEPNTTYYTSQNASEDLNTALYPYIYGWAVVEADSDIQKDDWMLYKDSVNTSDVWTTFGVGELSSGNSGYARPTGDDANSIDVPTSVRGGSFNVTPPAGLAKPPDEPYACPDQYAFRTSDAGGNTYLRFADFSDIDDMLEVDKVTKQKKDVLIVKAVYEQGRSLEESNHYSVVEGSLDIQRYSTTGSTNNATYSFQYQYQRVNENAQRQTVGVGRIRDPGVQTGMTYDVEEFGQKNSENQVFYIKNIADNRDVMDVDITVSGTIWNVKYKLVDLFDRNIATGVERSEGGELRLDHSFGYSDDVRYEQRQGTGGFVMQATLTTLLREATKAAKDPSYSIANHVGLDTITDLNFKATEDGTSFDRFNYGACGDIIKDLVRRMYNLRSDHPDFLDENGDVTLDWHQLQKEIILQRAGQGSILSSSGALTDIRGCAGFDWCRLCTEEEDPCRTATIHIVGYADLLKALRFKENSAPAGQEAITEWLIPTTLQDFGFRATRDGKPFQTRNEVLTAMEKAYAVLSAQPGVDAVKATWDEVQEIILSDTYPTGEITPPWWKDGGHLAVDSWDTLIDLSWRQYIDKDIPDALDGFDQAAFNALIPNAPAWLRKTAKLGDSHDGESFTDADEFKTAWAAAIVKLTTAKSDGSPAFTKEQLKSAVTAGGDQVWQAVQGTLIHRDEAEYFSYAQVLSSQERYWWKEGGRPPLTYQEFEATYWSHYRGGNDLKDLITSELIVNDDLHFRANQYGGTFASTDEFIDAVTRVLNMIINLDNYTDFFTLGMDGFDISWDEMQYMLIYLDKIRPNDTIPKDVDHSNHSDHLPDLKHAAFWWSSDGTGAPPQEPMTIGALPDLLQAAKWMADNTNPKALDALTLAEIQSLGLRKDLHGVPYGAGDVDAFKTALAAAYPKLLQANGGLYPADSVTQAKWSEVQYALAAGGFKSETDIAGDAAIYLWWKDGGTYDVTLSGAPDLARLLQAAYCYQLGATDALDGAVTVLDAIVDAPLWLRANESGASLSAATLYSQLPPVAAAIGEANLAGYSAANMDQWAEVQNAVISGSFLSHSDPAFPTPYGKGENHYWWYDGGAKPGGMSDQIDVRWDDDVKNAWKDYYWKTTNTGKLDTLANTAGSADTLEYINDVLLLRKNLNGEKFANMSELTTVIEGIKSSLFKKNMTNNYSALVGSSLSKKFNLTWWQFQKAIIDVNTNTTYGPTVDFPDDTTILANWPADKRGEPAENYYFWKLNVIPLDVRWDDDVRDAWKDYYWKTTNTGKLDALASEAGCTNTVDYINDVLLLRKNLKGEKFANMSELTTVIEGIKSSLFKKNMTNNYSALVGSSLSKKFNLTWWQFQKAIIDVDTNTTYGPTVDFPDDDAILADLANNNFRWRYQYDYSGVMPTPGT